MDSAASSDGDLDGPRLQGSEDRRRPIGSARQGEAHENWLPLPGPSLHARTEPPRRVRVRSWSAPDCRRPGRRARTRAAGGRARGQCHRRERGSVPPAVPTGHGSALAAELGSVLEQVAHDLRDARRVPHAEHEAIFRRARKRASPSSARTGRSRSPSAGTAGDVLGLQPHAGEGPLGQGGGLAARDHEAQAG